MSKAFTKEGEGDGLDDLPPVDEWPAGVKNYLTPAGHAALKRDIEALREAPRGDSRRKVQLEQRLQALLARLEAAEVIDPATQPRDVVRFGASVDVEDDDGNARRYRIVGVDEADPGSGRIAFVAPLARELTGKRLGDTVQLLQQGAPTEYEIIAIDYAQE